MKNKPINESTECTCTIIHADKIKSVKKNLLDDSTLFNLAEFFKIFGDSTRIKILYILVQEEMCVCDIAMVLKISQSAVSHQLRLLKNYRLVSNRKEGKIVYYTLNDAHISKILKMGHNHVKE